MPNEIATRTNRIIAVEEAYATETWSAHTKSLTIPAEELPEQNYLKFLDQVPFVRNGLSGRTHDWFELLTGFRETDYLETQRQLKVEGNRLRSLSNGHSYGIGILDVISLEDLRVRVGPNTAEGGRLRVKIVQGDVRTLHRAREFEGALFQVASLFNLLEMICPDVTPEPGVTRYERDGTQGPACAIAAGAATMYRNYFVPVGTQMGQTRDRQINCLAEVGKALAAELGMPVEALWTMENGYAHCTKTGLEAIGAWIDAEEELNAMRGRLRIGLHADVEVTDAEGPIKPIVSRRFARHCRSIITRRCQELCGSNSLLSCSRRLTKQRYTRPLSTHNVAAPIWSCSPG